MFVQILFVLAGLLCLFPFVSSGLALFLGVFVALTFGNPFLPRTRKFTPKLLQASVVGLGAGMNLAVVAQVGLHGVGYTALGISFALLLGYGIGKLLGTGRDITLLVSVGTAICGGSAIAAVSPVIRAKHQDISVALAVVFVLNSIALLIFPPLGHFFQMTQNQFGLWAALAIHDTSSVVGAGMQYGAQALDIATTVKLARALWIVPVAFVAGLVFAPADGEKAAKAKRPWFIAGFLIAAAIVTWIPALQPAGHVVDAVAKRLLVVTLFLIGASLTRETLKSVGLRPLVLGVSLWLIVGTASLSAILAGYIH